MIAISIHQYCSIASLYPETWRKKRRRVLLIRKEEEEVDAWLEQVKGKTEFVTVKAEGEETFAKRDEVEAHFRETHLAD